MGTRLSFNSIFIVKSMDPITVIGFFIAYTGFFILLTACWFCGLFEYLRFWRIASVLDGFSSSAKRIIPSRLLNAFDGIVDYTFYQRNPIFQIVYATLLFIGYTLYTTTAFPYVSESFAGRLPYYLLVVNLVLFAACCCTDPGIITKGNVDKYLLDYKYDGNMYIQKDCHTCAIKKPARSKHCSICNVCIARFDHHCSFLNICIGKHNNRYFIALLGSLVLMCAVSSFMIIMVFIHIVDTKRLHIAQYTDLHGTLYEASIKTVLQYLATSYPTMALLLLFLVCLFLALLSFYLFHCYLVLANKTTNELLSKGSSLQQRRKPGSRVLPNWRIFGPYSRGVLYNIFEVLLP